MENDLRRTDDVLIGRLVQSVETLTDEVKGLRAHSASATDLAAISLKVDALQTKANIGKGILYGAMAASVTSGAALSQLLGKLFPL